MVLIFFDEIFFSFLVTNKDILPEAPLDYFLMIFLTDFRAMTYSLNFVKMSNIKNGNELGVLNMKWAKNTIRMVESILFF